MDENKLAALFAVTNLPESPALIVGVCVAGAISIAVRRRLMPHGALVSNTIAALVLLLVFAVWACITTWFYYSP